MSLSLALCLLVWTFQYYCCSSLVTVLSSVSPGLDISIFIIVALVSYPCHSQLSIFLGLLISGGYSHFEPGTTPEALTDVEVWAPSTGQHCTVSSLPTFRASHSQEGSIVCGGFDDTKSCLTLTAEGSWERTTALLEER